MRNLLTILLSCSFLCFPLLKSQAQCDLYDGNGVASATPQWISCFGTDFNLTVQSPTNYADWTIDWGDGSAIESGTSLVFPAAITHTYLSTVATYNVTFTEVISGCQVLGTVIMEEPTTASIQIPFGGITQTCAPAPLEFINSSTNTSPTTVFTWDFGDGSPALVFDFTNEGDTISHTYQRGTVNCETFVTLSAENMCNTIQGGMSQATFNPIRIWDLDDASIGASATLLCYPDTTVVFDNTTDRNCLLQGNIFQRQEYWNFGNYWGTGSDSIIGWSPWPPTTPHTIGFPGIGSYDVMLLDSNFCGVDTANITITITAPPTANFSIDNDTICVNEVVTTTNLATGGGNTFFWNFGDGNGWQNLGAGSQTHTYISPGDYTISFVAAIGGAAGCSDTATLPVHVKPIPNANFILDNNNGCDTLTVLFTDASVDAITWAWDFGNGNTDITPTPPAQFYPNPGIYPVSLSVTAINGCTDTRINNVNVYESPFVDFQPQSVCQNSLASFTDLSTSAAGDPIISWNWDFDNGSTSTLQNPTTTFTTNGTFDVALSVATANCANSDTITLTVEPVPTASFTQDVNQGCPALSVNYTNTSTGAALHTWDFADGNTSNLLSPSNVFSNAGSTDTTYNVMLVASTVFGCSDTVYSPVTVYYGVTSSFSHDGFPGCAPLDVNFTNLSQPGENYFWDFGDGNSATTYHTTHQFVNSTLFIEVYDVSLAVTSSNGCTDTSTQSITAYPMPDFNFSSVPDSGCSPLDVTFPSVVGAVSYVWDFGDASTGTGPSPTHTYTNGTTNDVNYTVELIATSPFGCVDTNYGSVKVFPNPNSQFIPLVDRGCPPFAAQLQNNSTGAVSYLWDYGTGDTSTNSNALHSYTYFNTTTSSISNDVTLVSYTAEGCTDTIVTPVTVYPEVIADFNSDTAGCNPLPIDFTDQSVNNNQWKWDFGNGFTDVVQNPSHTFTNVGIADTNYTVELIATSGFGCTDTTTQNILVYPTPVAVFTATPVTQTYPDATITINNSSSGGSWNYNWDFGDGNNSSLIDPADHTYVTWGTYTIDLMISSPFCADSATQNITIIPPLPVPEIYGKGQGCRPVTVQFTDSSQYVTNYFWEFGDGGTSSQQHPLYTYSVAGDYVVQLTVVGPGGSATIFHTDTIYVHELANAFFQYSPTNVYVPNEPVQFFNLSSFADDYYWDFGDSTFSTDEFPEHFYQDPGTYDITLIANNSNNCPDTSLVENAVYAETGGEIVFPNAFTPNEDGSNGGVYDPASYNNDVFFPLYEGLEEYHLMVFNRWGELIFESFDPAIGWDGYYRDQLCQQDVYVWKAIVKFTNGVLETKAGEIHLLR